MTAMPENWGGTKFHPYFGVGTIHLGAQEIRLFGETLVGFGMNEDSVPECERWRLAILFKVGYNIWYSKNLWTEDNYGKKGS